jgi:hypothetical protein
MLNFNHSNTITMKKIIILGFMSFFGTMATAQILTLEVAGNVELCDDCGDSDVSMLCAKCNACKSRYSDDFVRLFNYGTERLGEIGKLSDKDEEWRQMVSLKAYINGELDRIKGHIRFCVQSEMRHEEAAIRKAIVTPDRKEQEPDATHNTPSSVTGGVAMGIAQTGDRLASDQQKLNENNLKIGDKAEENVNIYTGNAKAAEDKISELNNAGGQRNSGSNPKEKNNLKDKLQKQMGSSQDKKSEQQQQQQLQDRINELQKKIEDAIKKCPECADKN